MTQAIIIEDEKPASRRLQRMLEKRKLNVIAVLHSVSDSIEWLSNNHEPDVIFLDIQLNDGISFEIFEKVPVKSAIIFTTAYDEYALRAFKLNSVDYLLKPIDEEELDTAISKFHNNYTNSNEIVSFKEIRQFLSKGSTSEYRNRISVQLGQKLKIIDIKEISCFYSENKGTYLMTLNGRNYLTDSSLENLEADLDPKCFFRINRKSIVNIDAIGDIISYTNSRLELKVKFVEDFPLIVSRERVKGFREWISS